LPKSGFLKKNFAKRTISTRPWLEIMKYKGIKTVTNLSFKKLIEDVIDNAKYINIKK
jgi:hypothetical protein